MIKRLFVIAGILIGSALLIIMAKPKYVSIHESESRDEPKGHCIGIKRGVEISGYTPNPYGWKLHQFEVPIRTFKAKYLMDMRIGSRYGAEGMRKTLQRRLDKCEPDERVFGLNVYRREAGEKYDRCNHSTPTGAHFVAENALDRLSKIDCANEHVVNCRMEIARHNWRFNLSFPVGELENWEQIEEQFIRYVENGFEDLGVCK